ncbi:hypothetical protein CRM22_006604 [Opisthorchis felineus]|uniref:Adenosine deaminase domain-containing protein n=1 Tax=Opisthorchis felineus TaxID=147828 RepID=A0A4S2LRJ0_OPIFE|nr:hypothetical protein CRM22_006604 [Opisthorchis felineus]
MTLWTSLKLFFSAYMRQKLSGSHEAWKHFARRFRKYVSQTTLLNILDADQAESLIKLVALKQGDQRSLDECFALFHVLHNAIRSPGIVERVTVDVVEEFASDGVIYLELRTTVRRLPTCRAYLDAVLRGLSNASSITRGKIDARLLLSVDRARGLDDAWMAVDLLKEYAPSWPELLVGIELSGNPKIGSLLDFVEPLNCVQALGLKTSVHLAELPNEGEQWLEFLQCHTPDRIGHGTHLPTPDTPSDDTPDFKARDLILSSRIPIEICLTSNVVSETELTYESHHLASWVQAGHPVCICTDDKGIFGCSSSSELTNAVERCGVSRSQLQHILEDSARAAFCSEATKIKLLKQITAFFDACAL